MGPQSVPQGSGFRSRIPDTNTGVRNAGIPRPGCSDEILVSESVWTDLKTRDDVEALAEPREMTFDEAGNLTEW